MRYIAFLMVPLALAGQSAQPDSRVTEALVKEMQQLRVAIERSTLLGTRMQLAISELQIQDAAAARLSQQYNEVHSSGATTNVRKNKVAEQVKALEQRLNDTTNPQQRNEVQDVLTQMKYDLEEAAAIETARLAREGELAVQLQAAQAAIGDSRNRIAEMERALDAAIQQLLKEK
ncbi:MAG TPA: hypothetical protein VMH81_16845 [Bryobacteraceae bacterium]|nr:hypothetical protein [Bryobacteraceae bacterium]